MHAHTPCTYIVGLDVFAFSQPVTSSACDGGGGKSLPEFLPLLRLANYTKKPFMSTALHCCGALLYEHSFGRTNSRREPFLFTARDRDVNFPFLGAT